MILAYKRWYWNKGGEPVTDTILFGKYQLIRILGQGRSGTVYLARHLELEEYRAIKQVPKTCADYQQFKKEALLLKKLRHPNIPLVYDLQEDEDFSYLIEEFLEGDSFYDLIRKRGHLNQDAVIRYGIQLCDLVHYLHSAEDVPILYLDLQPRNLLLCHEQVKLLDFDHAGTCTEANQRKERYGTPGFCAPEQKKEGELGVYTDVYQIGAILAYLLTGHVENDSTRQIAGDLGKIIRRCLRSDEKERYQSAAEIRQELMCVHSETGVSDNQYTSLIFVFAGARRGVGVTHLALGLCAYLNRRGYPCLYEEWNSSNDVRAMARWLGKEMDSWGICDVFGVPAKPWYGEAVRLPKCQYPVVVRDYGGDWRAAGEAVAEAAKGLKAEAAGKLSQKFTRRIAGNEATDAMLVLVAGGKWWEQEHGAEVSEKLEGILERQGIKPEMSVVFNHAIPGIVKKKWLAGRQSRAYTYLQSPQFPSPFELTQESESFYKVLCESISMREMEFSGDRGRGAIWESVKGFSKGFTQRIGKKRDVQRRKRR